MHLNDLPAELAQFVDDALASGKYQSVEDLVGKALRSCSNRTRHEARHSPATQQKHIPLVP